MNEWLIYAYFYDGSCGVCVGRRKGEANARRFAIAFRKRNRRLIECMSWRPR